MYILQNDFYKGPVIVNVKGGDVLCIFRRKQRSTPSLARKSTASNDAFVSI